MRNRLFALGLSVSLVLALSACTRSDRVTGSGASSAGGAASTATADSGSSVAQTAAPSPQEGAAAGDAATAPSQEDAVAGGQAAGENAAPQNADGDGDSGEAKAAGEDTAVDAGDTFDALNQSGDGAASAPADGAPQAQEEGWDGTFVNAEEETLTISSVDEFTISFAFAQSGISGTAAVDGDGAVYQGDDGVTVLIENQGGSMEVSVTNENGEDEASTIGGEFIRQ